MHETNEKCIISLCYKLSYLKIEKTKFYRGICLGNRYRTTKQVTVNHNKLHKKRKWETFCIFTVI
jgi:hypothetical protein